MSNNQRITTNNNYNGYNINASHDEGLACYTAILDRYLSHLNDMVDNHSKVLQIRFDLRYPSDGSVLPNRLHVEDFHYNFKRKLNSEKTKSRHLIDPRFITVQEQHGSNHPHYHCVLLVNGNAKQNYYPILLEAEHQWKNILKTDQLGLVDHCNQLGSNGIIIDRNSVDFHNQMNDCIYQASYLAKTRGKDNNPKGSWLAMGTRIPKR